MVDASKRPLHIPPWQIPYLEKHRIFELFHELARELVIRQPDDHVSFLKEILFNAARSRNIARVVLLTPPKLNGLEIGNAIAELTKQAVITENAINAFKGTSSFIDPQQKAKCIAHLVRKDSAYERGWILIDCIKSANDAKALLEQGILPTHVLHFIPPFHLPLDEILYCHVPTGWPEYRRTIFGIREVFKSVLVEIHMYQRNLPEIINDCVDVLNSKPAKYPIKPRVLIIGPRGSGRRTQAKILADKLGLVHVDFERLICEAWMSEKELGQKLRACKDDVCFHSELLAEVVHKRVLEYDCIEHGWVLTGFPYTRRDFEYLDCIHTPPNRVIFLECDLTVCKERIVHRQINVHTGSVTNVVDNPEAVQEKELKAHPKDNRDLVDSELSYYCENYGELRKYCGSSANCINADQAERWIHENILSVITRAPPLPMYRQPLDRRVLTPSTSTGDTCCCTPVPSQVMDSYMVSFDLQHNPMKHD